MTDDDIPVLTAVVRKTGNPERDAARNVEVSELEFKLTAASLDLAERLLGSAFQEMEAAVFDNVSNRLRSELPGMISEILREHLTDAGD